MNVFTPKVTCPNCGYEIDYEYLNPSPPKLPGLVEPIDSSGSAASATGTSSSLESYLRNGVCPSCKGMFSYDERDVH